MLDVQSEINYQYHRGLHAYIEVDWLDPAEIAFDALFGTWKDPRLLLSGYTTEYLVMMKLRGYAVDMGNEWITWLLGGEYHRDDGPACHTIGRWNGGVNGYHIYNRENGVDDDYYLCGEELTQKEVMG